MADDAPIYDTSAIRELLLAAFTADGLRRFCQDRTEFRPVLQDVGANPSPNELADQILVHCETHLLFDQLLAEVRRLNPGQYERFEPRLLLPEGVLAEVPCPYRGLEVFYAEHAANYFGREAMVAKLLDRLDETNFVAVVGPSGCGKSSLVRAGMVPALRRGALPGSEAWRVETFLPGDDALRALALTLVHLLMPEATPVDRLAEARKLADHLHDDTLPMADVLAQIRDQYPELPRLVLVVDQFEEAFTLCTDETQCGIFSRKLLDAAEMPWLTGIPRVGELHPRDSGQQIDTIRRPSELHDPTGNSEVFDTQRKLTKTESVEDAQWSSSVFAAWLNEEVGMPASRGWP